MTKARLVHFPIGHLVLVAGDDGLREIRFRGEVPERPAGPGDPGTEILDEAEAQLTAYFAGDLRDFDLSLAPRGTDFQLRVWSTLAEIPYGETWSYGDLAKRVGQPTASRAVGAANGRNPLPIVLPCHRVIGADGSLTGYGGGLEIKRHLLRLEGALGAPSLFDGL